jgi:2-C-methyl-D-erythritol 2,4-cyclodiphosphate synthase
MLVSGFGGKIDRSKTMQADTVPSFENTFFTMPWMLPVSRCMPIPMTRSGLGYDVHPFTDDKPLVLGGVEIPHHRGLRGHSDADVLCHAIADAVLGALGLPDIGHWFPPSDPSIAGISSLRILEKCAELAAEKSARINNVDSTLIAEAPRIRPHVGAMQERIGAALGIAPSAVGVKATTNERLGFVGREEGIAAMAVASVEVPE